MHFVHQYAHHDIIATKTMLPSDRAHPQLYCVKFWSKSDWQFPRYSHFVSYPLSLAFPFWPLSDSPAPETWPQNQLHNWSPSLPRPLQTPSLVCWQLGQHPSACQSMTGIPKMLIILSPYFAIPWRTGSSSTTSHQTVRTTSDMSLQPWEPNPWKCMHNGCQLAAKRSRKWPRWKLPPSSTESSREWHMTSIPMCILENLKILWPGWERTPKIS